MQQLIDIGRDLNAVIIGLGGQGLRRAKAIEIAKGWKLAGVFDTDQKRCRQVCERFHWRLIDCLQTAVSHPDIDLVVIAVPPAHHDEIMKLACQFQKHILCEKPLTIWPENFHEQLPCGVQGSQILATGFNHRFYGPVLDAVELIHQNKLGQIQQINGRIGSPTPDSKLDGWHGNASISGGGVLTDNGSHLIDLLQMILRRPLQYSLFDSKRSTSKPDIETYVKFGLVENHGIKGCFEASWLDTTNPYLKLDFQFESGKIELSAFPWHIRWTDTSGRWKQKYYLRNRISMKFLNFQAPGLEASLWRELASIRNSILGIPQISVNHASFADGLEVAKSVESLRREILMNERQDTLAFPSLSSQLRQFQEKQSV